MHLPTTIITRFPLQFQLVFIGSIKKRNVKEPNEGSKTIAID